MESNIQRTVYDMYLSNCIKRRRPFKILPHSTLNEKLEINDITALNKDEYPYQGFVAIGVGGHSFKAGADGIMTSVELHHSPTDAALFKQVPFILREESNDINDAQREIYGLRKIIQVGQTRYVGYFLKRLDFSESVPRLEYITKVGDTENVDAFLPTIDNLSSTPVSFSNEGVNAVDADLISASDRVAFTMTENEISEFVNACKVLYGSSDYAIISEMAICSGVDRVVTGLFNGVAATYKDVIAVQVNHFVNVKFEMKYVNKDISFVMDLGASEPLMVIE